MNKFGLHSKRVLLEGALKEATVVIQEGKILAVLPGPKSAQDFEVFDHGSEVIMPGLIDSHVHINEPGRTDWEGFDSATRSAAAGGITTLIDMPLNATPVTTSKENFQLKLDAAKDQCHVNCGFWGGMVPANHDELEELLRAGVYGLKIFLTHSGIDDFPNVTRKDIIRSAPILQKNNALLLAHCELESENDKAHFLEEEPESYQAYLKSRPRKWEDDAIAMMIELCEQYQIRTHIVHLSSSDSIKQIIAAKNKGLPLTVETCPHYLFFESQNIPDRSTIHKCAPPIRESENNKQLWKALESGLIDFVVSDHSPAPPDVKGLESGNFKTSWGGIASLQFGLPAMWTMADKNGMSISAVANLMSKNIAAFLGLEKRKGKIQEGFDADLVIWNPEASFIVKSKDILHKHKITPYLGEHLKGRVKKTYVKGRCVFDQGSFTNLNQGEIMHDSKVSSLIAMEQLNALNIIDDSELSYLLEKCCGSNQWVMGMLREKPFLSEEDLQAKADKVWSQCSMEDGLEAFEHHPKIGDKKNLEKKFASTKEWAGNEQKEVDHASSEIIEKLMLRNEEYYNKFGYIFIVFATGKSATEMLDILEARIKNDPQEEIKIAMAEQHKITKLRLNKLLS